MEGKGFQAIVSFVRLMSGYMIRLRMGTVLSFLKSYLQFDAIHVPLTHTSTKWSL